MRPLLTSFFRCLVALALLVPATLMITSPAAAATTLAATTTCSNGVDNTGGLGLICQVTVVNTITATGGSATVTVHECHGAAGAPSAACTDKTAVLTAPVTAVTQCNDSINGGGGTLRCSVVVTSNFYGVSPGSTAATVNQCVGSGGGITTGCDPFPANTTGAAITQCNGSANGGTLVGLTCTATGTMASAHGVTVNQCNGSANGGGALVICSASVINNAVSSTPTPAGTPAPTRTPPPTSTVSDRSSSNSTPFFPLMIFFALAGLGLATLVVQRRSIRS
ncbi:MAG TPA: hypothetical protein VF371_01960 [Candidatus Limnocylindrales bacterium]